MPTMEATKESRRLKSDAARQQPTEECLLLGIEPSGKVAFAQVGANDATADEATTEAMLERYPNLAYVAVVSARVVNVRKEQPRLHRPR